MNRTKNEVVKSVEKFVEHGKELIEKTSNIQQTEAHRKSQSAEDMANIVKKAHEVASKSSRSIPDLKVSGVTPGTKPTVKFDPANANQFKFGDNIQLAFSTSNITPPFEYYIIGKESATPASFEILGGISRRDTKVLVPIKKENTIPLDPGKYDITVRILDRARNPIAIDQIKIEVEPARTPPGVHTIDILSPLGAKSPYTTNMPIDIEFKVSGPHHDAVKEYYYMGIIVDAGGNTVFDIKGTVKDKNVMHIDKFLPKRAGQYTIKLSTGDPKTRTILAPPKIETFVVQTFTPFDQSLTIVQPDNSTGPIMENTPIMLMLDTTKLTKPFLYEAHAIPKPPTSGPNVALVPQTIISATSRNAESYKINEHIRPGTYYLTVVYKNSVMPSPAFRRVEIKIVPNPNLGRKNAVDILKFIGEIRKEIDDGRVRTIKRIDDLRKEIWLGINTADIRKATGSNAKKVKYEDLEPYKSQIEPVIYASLAPSEIRRKADEVMNNANTHTLVKGVCGALINAGFDFEYYLLLDKIFDVNRDAKTEYIKMLQEYEGQKTNLIKYIDSINKTGEFNNTRIRPQDLATKILQKIELAVLLLYKKP